MEYWTFNWKNIHVLIPEAKDKDSEKKENKSRIELAKIQK
jgi:hypothetical protein